MSFAKPTLTEIGYHEAGHAYAYAALVRMEEPEELSVGWHPDGHAAGHCKRKTLFDHETRIEDQTPRIQAYFRRWAAMDIVIATAGYAAELQRAIGKVAATDWLLEHADELLKPGALDVDGDIERVRTVLAVLQPVDPSSTLRAVISVSSEIVFANILSIDRLARRLIRHKRLGPSELAAWFMRRPAVPYDPSDLAVL